MLQIVQAYDSAASSLRRTASLWWTRSSRPIVDGVRNAVEELRHFAGRRNPEGANPTSRIRGVHQS